jgi:hypothetical protein
MRMKKYCVGADTTLLVALFASLGFSDAASAQALTLSQALGLTYENNPQLNAQRAALRAVPSARLRRIDDGAFPGEGQAAMPGMRRTLPPYSLGQSLPRRLLQRTARSGTVPWILVVAHASGA